MTQILRATRAVIVESLTTNGHTTAIRVRCPWCHGTHQHAYHPNDTPFAYPTCGTPGVGYWMQWPTQETA